MSRTLQTCPLLQKIMGAWSDWFQGRQPPEERDRFWEL